MFVTAFTALAASAAQPAPPVAVTNSTPPIVRITTAPPAPRATPNAPPTPVVSAPSAPKKSGAAANPKSAEPDFETMMKMFDKLFPPQPAPDPARLALSRTTVETLWPNGTYGRMMGAMIGPMYDRVLAMKQSDFDAMEGKPAKPGAAGDLTLRETLMKDDPKFDEHATMVRTIVVEEFNKLALIFEPKLRAGLANAYARRFDARQLTEINAFLATPTGKAFGNDMMVAWMDGDVMRGMMSSVPEMMQAAPAMMVRVQGAIEKIEADKKASKPAKK